MLSLTTLLILSKVYGTNALFKPKKTLIYLCTLYLAVLLINLAVTCALTSSKINKEKFSTFIDSLFLDLDLADSMRARRSVITPGSMSCAHAISLGDQFKNLLFTAHKLLHEALDLNLLVPIFQQLQLLVIV